MDFKQLEAFVNVVRHRSFSRAADASFLTQPTVSAHVRTLENELGSKLIIRKKSEALPTEEGKRLYAYAVEMMNIRMTATKEIGCGDIVHDGHLSIHASSVPAECLVTGWLCAFRREHPDARFYVEQKDSREVKEDVLKGQCELGIIGENPGRRLAHEPVGKDFIVIITPKSPKFNAYAAAGTTLPVEAILDEPFIWREEGSATRREFEKRMEEKGFMPGRLTPAAFLNSPGMIKSAVAQGLGVSAISRCCAESGGRGRESYHMFTVEGVTLERSFYLIWNRHMTLSPMAKAFKRMILAEGERRR